MMGFSELSRRVAMLERFTAGSPDTPHMDAKAFTENILRLASRFDGSSAHMSADQQRACLSPASRLAWALRFADDGALAVVLRETEAVLEAT